LLAIFELEEKLIKDRMSKTDQCMDLATVVLICVLDSQSKVDTYLKKE